MHQQFIDAIDQMKAAIANDNPAIGGGGKLGGILKVLWPILQGILNGILGGGTPTKP